MKYYVKKIDKCIINNTTENNIIVKYPDNRLETYTKEEFNSQFIEIVQGRSLDLYSIWLENYSDIMSYHEYIYRYNKKSGE